jgi:Protein of unknown function (DUF1571)
MSRTKEGATRRLAGAARALALGLCVAMLGCADSGGLRSVWPDRPSVLGLWDRKPQPSPDPADDYYARYMNTARERSHAPAKPSRDNRVESSREDESGPPAPDDTLVAADRRAPSASRPSRRDPDSPDDSDRDETIRVTLGPPQPLPGAPRSADATLASARAPSSRESDLDSSRSPAERSPAPSLARQAEQPPESNEAAPISRPAPRRPAAQPKRSSPSTEKAQAILAQSEAKLRSLSTYQVKMSRVERVDGQLQPEEEVILSVHREPKEVRLQWTSGPSQGREVIYSTRVDNRSLFVHMPKSAIPLPTMKMAIDSPMVTRSSRHSIAEAGFDTIVENLRKSVDQVDAANTAQGRAAYRGIEKPPGLDRPSHVFTRRSPNGESWTVFIDARSLLPSMVVAKNPSGDLDEKYVYHEVIENPAELASADAFDPDRRWGASNGLLSRFARGGSAAASPSNGQSKVR